MVDRRRKKLINEGGEKRYMRIKRNEKGITLIALIITIIILVILAAVSIRAVANMGIVGHAINGTQDYARAAKAENEKLDTTGNFIDNALGKLDNIQNGNGAGENGAGGNNDGDDTSVLGPNGKPLVNSETVSDYVTGTEPLDGEDRYGNPIKIPVGFKVASDSGADVTEGIVIEDDDVQTDGNGNQRGNQYVWIPTGTIYTDTAMTVANAKTITAGRCEFADGTSTYTKEDGTTVTPTVKGTPVLKQSLANYATQPTNITYGSTYHEVTNATNSQIVINNYYYEVSTYRAGVASSGTDGLNRTAYSLSSFANSVATNHGYYIARYEASWGTGNKVKSRVSVGDVPNSAPSSRTNGQLWNFVKQVEAAEACQGLYEGKINSDLMNSYAWDTAIVFLQTFSGDEDYSYQTSRKTGSNPSNTGVNNDEVCKINDMASNNMEWTTEYSPNHIRSSAVPCVYRGGHYGNPIFYTASRNRYYATVSDKTVTFRPTLYL